MVDGCGRNIYIVFENFSSRTDLVSDLSFPNSNIMHCDVLVMLERHSMILFFARFRSTLSLTLDRTLVGVSPVPVYLVFRIQSCLLSCYLTHVTRSWLLSFAVPLSTDRQFHFPVGHLTRIAVSRTQRFFGAHNRPEVCLELRCSPPSHRRLRTRAFGLFLAPLARQCDAILLQ